MTNENRLDIVDDEAEAVGERLFEMFEVIKTVFAHPNSVRPAEYVEAARLAKFLLEAIAATGDAPEYMDECVLSGETLGHLLMQNIGTETDLAKAINKRKWLEVAEVIGPDHAQTLYRAAVFTTKVA